MTFLFRYLMSRQWLYTKKNFTISKLRKHFPSGKASSSFFVTGKLVFTYACCILYREIAIFLTNAGMEILRNRCENRMRKIPLNARVWNKILCTEAILQIHK